MWIADLHRMIISLWNAILLATYQMLGKTPDTWGTGAGNSPWTVAHGIHEGLMGVAVGLALLFWFVSFFKYIEDFHKIDLREVAGWILRFAVILVIMQFSWMIMEAVLDLSIGVNAQIMESVGLTGDAADWEHYTAETAMVTEGFMHESQELQDAVDAVNLDSGWNIFEYIGAFFEALPISLFMFLIWAVVLCCGCVIMVILYLRFFKMYIYTALAPLPLSTFAGSSTGEIGKHFLKAWASVCLELCVMTIAVVIFAASMSNADTILPFLGDGEGEMGNAANLWTVSMQWSIGVLVKSILLVSVLKGSDHIMEKIIGV